MADLDDRVVYINRVSKAISGGSTFSFSTMVAVGDGNGRVGIGIGQGEEVPASIEKGRYDAEKELLKVPTLGTTIPHEIEARHDAAHVLLKPASPGTGVIAGGAVRSLVELAGIKDILTKSLGSDNPLNIARATMKAFDKLKDPHRIANLRGIPVEELLKDNPYGGPTPEEVAKQKEKEEKDEETGSQTEEAEEQQQQSEEDKEEAEETAEAEEEVEKSETGSPDESEPSSNGEVEETENEEDEVSAVETS